MLDFSIFPAAAAAPRFQLHFRATLVDDFCWHLVGLHPPPSSPSPSSLTSPPPLPLPASLPSSLPARHPLSTILCWLLATCIVVWRNQRSCFAYFYWSRVALSTDWKTFRCDISAVIVAAFASFGSFARFSARCFRILHASLCWHIEIIFVQHAFICCLRSEHITHTHPKPMQESDCSPIFFQLAHTLTSPRSQFTEQYDINVAYTMFRDNNRYSLNAHNYLRVFLRSVSSQLLIGAWCRIRCAIIDKSFLSECIQSATETTKATASRSWQF